MTKAVFNARQREYRRRTNYACNRRYEKTPKGFLVRSYQNMLNRTRGLVKPHLYKGLPILPREEFYEFSLHDPAFNAIYRRWVRSGYLRALSPSVNRIDPTKGYEITNIEWLPHGVNSGLGAMSRRRGDDAMLERIHASATATQEATRRNTT